MTPVFRTIRARLLVTYQLITVLGMSIVSGYLVYAFRDFYLSRAEEAVRAGGLTLARAMREPLRDRDDDDIAHLTSACPQRPWETLRVFDAAGRLLAVKNPHEETDRLALHSFNDSGELIAARPSPPPVNPQWSDPWIQRAVTTRRTVEVDMPGMRSGMEKRFIVVPVLDGQQGLLGVVRLSLYPVDFERVFTGVRNRVIGALVAAFALCTLVSVLVARGIARPIRAMTRFAEAIGRGGFGRHLAVGSRDELGALAAHLNQMSDRLAQTDAERRKFLASVSHELRTPVSNVQVTLESLIGGAAEEPETRHRFLQAALGETERLTRLIRDLIDLARLEAGVVRMRHQEVRLLDVVQRAVAALEPRLRERGLAVRSEVPHDLYLWVDPDRFLQVLMNLFDNAIKFAPEETSIEITATGRREQVTIVVRDQGPGIPPEDLPHIFEGFYTADKSRARAVTGTGLGLAIVRTILEAHGGRISARSEPAGAGAEFTITLPH